MSQPDAFSEDIVRSLPRLHRFAITLTRDRTRAADLVQETVLRALAAREKFKEGTNLAAWLTVIMRNSFRTAYRNNRRHVEDPDDQMAKSVPVEDSPLKKLEIAELFQLIDNLPDQWRRPLRMIADGATYEEIALEMQEHVGTIKSRVNRAREMLKPAT